ncbi:MAG: hypothetical protein LBF64_07020 [Oscillospiraceae bacterium]|jgi:hypothetical protein|nr:hypothetical protein [Oscillospiraceae bacterium]
MAPNMTKESKKKRREFPNVKMYRITTHAGTVENVAAQRIARVGGMRPKAWRLSCVQKSGRRWGPFAQAVFAPSRRQAATRGQKKTVRTTGSQAMKMKKESKQGGDARKRFKAKQWAS